MIKTQFREIIKEQILLESVSKMFRTDTTNIPYYDGMLKNKEYYESSKGVAYEIKYMSPEDYLITIAKEIFNTNYKNAIDYMIEEDLIDEYVEAAKSGDKFPMVIIDYYRKTQEGRHRAYVAKLLNIKKIPVMVVWEI